MVKAEAQFEEQFTFDQPGRDAGVPRRCTDGTEKDGVARLQVLEDSIRKGLAGLKPVLGTELVVGLVRVTPSAATTFSRTFSASAMTSGPMPSPGMTARLMVDALIFSG